MCWGASPVAHPGLPEHMAPGPRRSCWVPCTVQEEAQILLQRCHKGVHCGNLSGSVWKQPGYSRTLSA